MKRITLEIDGMKCGMCEAHINDAIRRACKVKKISSSHKKGQTVILCEDTVSQAQLREAVEKDGYKVLRITEEEYTKRGLFRW